MNIIVTVVICGESKEVTLQKMYEMNEANEVNEVWCGYPEDFVNNEAYIIKIFRSSENEVGIEKGIYIETNESDIREQFIEYVLELERRKLESTLSGIEDTDEKLAENDRSINPYDPELIRVDPRQFSIKYIQEMLESEDKELDLSPDFQRNFVWNDITRKSRLIESLLLRIPLPVFYFSQDKEGKFQVVDGVQRLTVIHSFMNNEFRLRNLEYLLDCEGKYFNKKDVSISENLDSKYVRRINMTQINCNVIDPQTPPKVKFDIFKRINTGGKILNPQEIRNCFANSRVRDLLRKLVRSDEFIKATGNSVSSLRMADQDLVLRFIGFYYIKVMDTTHLSYKSDMDNFLDHVLMFLNEEKEQELIKVEEVFLNSMKNAYHLFQEHAFRKIRPEHLKPGARKQMLNKSLFVSIAVTLSKYPYESIKTLETGALKKALASEIQLNGKFFDALTNGTTDLKKVNLSFRTTEKVINRELEVLL